MTTKHRYPIIALWTYPRTISTAFERVMMKRGDFDVFHEPFSYLYYVHEDTASIEQEYIDPDHPTTYPAIKEMLLAAAEKHPVFFKDMAAHCVDSLLGDRAFLTRLTHTFLIRDPAKTIASFFTMNPDVTLAEIGCEQLLALFEAARGGRPQPPVVVDADDLEENPAGIVAAFCQLLDMAFIPSSLHWEPQMPAKWKSWQTWHIDAANSTGIQKNVETFEVTVDNSAHLKSLYDYHLPFYRAMHRHRIAAVDV